MYYSGTEECPITYAYVIALTYMATYILVYLCDEFLGL